MWLHSVQRVGTVLARMTTADCLGSRNWKDRMAHERGGGEQMTALLRLQAI